MNQYRVRLQVDAFVRYYDVQATTIAVAIKRAVEKVSVRASVVDVTARRTHSQVLDRWAHPVRTVDGELTSSCFTGRNP